MKFKTVHKQTGPSVGQWAEKKKKGKKQSYQNRCTAKNHAVNTRSAHTGLSKHKRVGNVCDPV